MFDSLNKGLANAFNKLKGGNVLTENNIKEAIKIVKRSLIEADVELDTVKSLINEIKTEAIGQKIYKNIKAQEAFIKIVNDHIVEILGNENQEIDLDKNNISYIMMVGLQGAGKTTTSAKLAKLLQKEKNKKVLLASLDIYRPAARKQLEVLANDNNIESFPIDEDNKNIKSLVKEIKAYAKEKECKIVILDTAGRLHIDNELMEELSLIKDLTKPTETLLIADSLTGQDSVNIAMTFNDKVNISGIIMTRVDGDARGGATLSMRYKTGKPIKYLASGETINDIDVFHPDRVASRILDMGDIVSLVEKANQEFKEEEAEKLSKKIAKGKFDFNDFASQIKLMDKMGGFSSILTMLPGMGGLREQLKNFDPSSIKKQLSIIQSMNEKEKANPEIICKSRRRRIAKGSGVSESDVDNIIKVRFKMSVVMKQFKGMSQGENGEAIDSNASNYNMGDIMSMQKAMNKRIKTPGNKSKKLVNFLKKLPK